MDRLVTHPTKEQVRAYMLGREHASRPPPRPEEIRQQLGWHVVASESDNSALITLCLLPATLGQLALQTVMACCMAPIQAGFGTQPGIRH